MSLHTFLTRRYTLGETLGGLLTVWVTILAMFTVLVGLLAVHLAFLAVFLPVGGVLVIKAVNRRTGWFEKRT